MIKANGNVEEPKDVRGGLMVYVREGLMVGEEGYMSTKHPGISINLPHQILRNNIYHTSSSDSKSSIAPYSQSK